MSHVRLIEHPAGEQVQIGAGHHLGNADGDFAMLQWTTTPQSAQGGSWLGLIMHHADAEREYAYDRSSRVGRLVRGLDEGPKLGWVIVDMKADWNAVFPPQ